MEIFLETLKNRAPRWTAETAWLYALLLVYLTALAFLCGVRGKKLLGTAALYTYVFNVLVTTLLMREPADHIRCTLKINFIRDIFIEHNAAASAEAVLNFLMLLPVGLFMPVLFGSFRTLKTCVFGFALTLFIEITQLVTRLGEFQADDLILNYLGCFAGAWIAEGIYALKRRNRSCSIRPCRS